MAFRRQLSCYICERRDVPQRMVRIHGDERMDVRNIAIDRRANLGRPDELVGENTRICFNCNVNIANEIRAIAENPMSTRLNVLIQRRNHVCIFCNADEDLVRLSVECKVDVYIKCDIFFPENVRSCGLHLDGRNFILTPLLRGLECINRQYVVNGPYLTVIFDK